MQGKEARSQGCEKGKVWAPAPHTPGSSGTKHTRAQYNLRPEATAPSAHLRPALRAFPGPAPRAGHPRFHSPRTPPGHPSPAPAVSPARPTPATKYAALPTGRTACRHTSPHPAPQAQPTATQTLQSPQHPPPHHHFHRPLAHTRPPPHTHCSGRHSPHLCPHLLPPLGYRRHLRQGSPSHSPAPGPGPSRGPLDTLPGACCRVQSRRGTPTWPGPRCEATELGTRDLGPWQPDTCGCLPALPRRVSPGASAGSGPGPGDANLC